MATEEELVFAAKYPFSEQAKNYLESMKIDFSKIDSRIFEIAFQRTMQAVENKRDSKKRLTELNNSRIQFLAEQLISYPVSKIIVALTGSHFIKKQLAVAESSDIYYFLQLENERNVENISRQIFSIGKEGNLYTIPFHEYVNNIPEGKEYKLINSEIVDGLVYIEKETISKLISKFVYNSVMNTKADATKLPPKFSELSKELMKSGKDAMEIIDFGPLNPEFFPPCIKKITTGLKSGEKIGHVPRFVLSTFFANIGMPVDKAVDYFKEQPNFDEKRTRYHLEHSTGKNAGTKYSMPSCATMESYGLCFRNDTCKWKHPLSYYKIMKTGKRKYKK